MYFSYNFLVHSTAQFSVTDKDAKVSGICDTTSELLCWKARALIINGETTEVLAMSLGTTPSNKPSARQLVEQDKTGPPEENWLVKRMDKSKPTSPATHSRRHTRLA